MLCGWLKYLQARYQWAPRAPAVPADGGSVDPVVPVIDGPLLEIPTKSVKTPAPQATTSHLD